MSENPRDRHVEAVGFASLQVEDMEGSINVVLEKLGDEVLPAIMAAVGAHPGSAAGNNALNLALSIREGLNLVMGTCEAIKSELNDYSQGQ